MVDAAIALFPPDSNPEHTPVQPFASDSAIERARRMDPAAIAAYLTSHFPGQALAWQAHWKDDYLVLLVDATPLPPVDDLLPPLQQHLEALRLEFLSTVHCYGRTRGEPMPQWGRKLTLAPPSAGSPALRVPSVNRSVADWLAQGQAGQVQKAPVGSQPGEDMRFLRCWLGSDHALLIPLVDIQSVFTVGLTSIVPIPHMADTLLGIHHYRGEMLWMLDLDAHLGLDPGSQDISGETMLTVIVIAHRGTTLGCVTRAQIGIETHSAGQVHQASGALFPDNLAPYVAEYLQESGIPILDVSTLGVFPGTRR